MLARILPPTFAAASQKLTAMGFALSPLSGNKTLVRHYGCAAVISPVDNGRSAEITLLPGVIVNGEWSRLLDRGYQKFFKTADAEVPARPEELKALARFENELRFACGIPSLYNESLGSVSDRYLYDRIWFRDAGTQPKPWEQEAAAALRG